MKKIVYFNFLSAAIACLLMATTLQAQNAEEWRIIEASGAPSNRHENGAFHYNNKLYLIGGRGTLPVDVYDPAGNSWSKLPAPPIEMHHMQPVAVNGKIYVVGAFTGHFPSETPISNVWIFDPASGNWQEGPAIPANRKRGSAGVVVHDNKIYVVSGITNGHIGGHVPWLDVFNPATGSWNTLPDAPRSRDHFHAAVHNGKIYAVGGRNTTESRLFEDTINEVDVYDIAAGSWTTIGSNIPTPRAGNSVAVIGDDLIVIGGESGAQHSAHRETEVLNLADHTWRRIADLNTGRHGTQAVVIGNTIYMACGSVTQGGNETNTMEALTYGGGANPGEFNAQVTNLVTMNGSNEGAALQNGAQLDLTDYLSFSIKADVNGDTPGSVVFKVTRNSGAVETYVDNVEPFILGGYNWERETYTVEAIPFSASGGQGIAGEGFSRTFTIVEVVSIRENLVEKFNFKAFPNPFTDKITFEFTSQSDGDVRVSIYDIAGNLVQEVYNGKSTPGKRMSVSYNKENKLSAGIYIARLQLGNESINYKILLR